MRKALEFLKIIQIISNKERDKKGLKRLGNFYEAKRLNPYNPLSYVLILLVPIIGTLMFGLIGFWKEVGNVNPFKWS